MQILGIIFFVYIAVFLVLMLMPIIWWVFFARKEDHFDIEGNMVWNQFAAAWPFYLIYGLVYLIRQIRFKLLDS